MNKMMKSNQPLPHAITTEELRYRRDCEKMLQSRKQHMQQRQRYSSYGNSPFVASAWIVNGCHFYPLIDHQQYAQLQLHHEEQQQTQQRRQRHQSHGRSFQHHQHHQGLKKQAKKQVTKKSMGSPGPKHSKRIIAKGNDINLTESDINDTNKPLRPRGHRGRGSRVRQNAKRRAKANNKRESGNIVSRLSPPGRHNVTLAHWLDAAESRRKQSIAIVDDDKPQLVESQQPSQLFLPVVSEGRTIGSILVWVPPTDDDDEGGYDDDERQSFIDEFLQLDERDDVETSTLSYQLHPTTIDDRMTQNVEPEEVDQVLAMLCEGKTTADHAAELDAIWKTSRSNDDVKVVDKRDDDDDDAEARLEASLRMDERDCADAIACSDFDHLSLWG